MQNIVVDFESYYSKKQDISAGTAGVVNYVRDSYAYMMSVVGPGLEFIGTIEEAQAKFPDSFWEDPGNRFWAANANFDQLWVQRYWPDAKAMKPWHCILDRGATEQLPQSLSGIARALWGKKVDKSIRDWMDGKHYRDITPEQQKEVLQYCLDDAKEEQHVLETLPEPSSVEQQIAAHTRMANLRGVRIDADRLKRDREELLRHQHDAFMRIPWHNDESPLSPLALAAWATQAGVPVPASLAKDDEECASLVGAHPKLAAVIGAMRQYRKANTLVRKIESVEGRITDNGTMALELMYCGARHTRRWSSRGVNVQNLDREPYYLTADGKPAEGAWDVWPRRWLIPREGRTFLILDYAQIEPRCLNWLVGNDALLNAIRSGFGIYEAYARISGQWRDLAPLKKANPHLYKSVKAQVLGLGYGMGASRYKETAAKDGIILTDEEAKATVSTWRKLNPEIIKFWGQMDETIKAATMDRSKLLEIEMPTGDKLRHFSVRYFSKAAVDPKTGMKITDLDGDTVFKRGYESFTTKGDFTPMSKQPNLWGGTITENVTQRMARDVLAEAVIRLENAGLPVVFHAHDEVILEVDIGSKEEAKKEAEKILGVAPEWAPDLPLGVEGDFADTYVK
jgi:DNA polymerase